MATFSIRRRQLLTTPYEFDDSTYTAGVGTTLYDLVVALVLTAAAVGVLYLVGTYFAAPYDNSGTHQPGEFSLTNGLTDAGQSASYGPSLR